MCLCVHIMERSSKVDKLKPASQYFLMGLEIGINGFGLLSQAEERLTKYVLFSLAKLFSFSI
jgi:hypothetical protein